MKHDSEGMTADHVLRSFSFTDFDLGYGVTSKFWDYVFGTVLPMEVK